MPQASIVIDVLADGERSQVGVRLEPHELIVLERYAAFCHALKGTIFARGDIKPIQIGLNEAGGLDLSVEPPERQEVSHGFHELRPLILQSEPTEFTKVRNVVSRRVQHDGVRDYLRFLRRYYELRPLDTDPILSQAGSRFGEFDTSSDKDLQKYLNAFEFHRDPDKEAEIMKGVGEPNKNLLQQDILFAFVQRTGIILDLCNLCQAVTTVGRSFQSGYGWKPRLFIRRSD